MSDRRDESLQPGGDSGSHTHDPTLRLRDYQVEGAAFMARKAKALVTDDPGLGKTCQAIRAHVSASSQGCVVVCPAVAVGVWAEEIAKWAPEFRVRVQETSKPVPPPALDEFLVTTYGRAKLEPGRYGTLIADEAHNIKNPAANRTKRCQALAKGAARVWALTGTPILRDPTDLWSIVEFLGLDRASYGTFSGFLRAFGGKKNPEGYGLVWDKPTAQAWAALSPWVIGRKRGEVLDLPERTHENIWLDLPKRAANRFAEMAERYPADDERWEEWATGGELAGALADLSSVKAASFLSSGLSEYAPTKENPLVIFSAHRQAAHLLAEATGWPLITGATSARDRTKIAAQFQAGCHAGLVATIAAAGVALTLTRAATAVFISRTFVPALNSQAEDRIYRFGQTQHVRVVICRSNSPLEFAIDRVLKRKAPYVQA